MHFGYLTKKTSVYLSLLLIISLLFMLPFSFTGFALEQPETEYSGYTRSGALLANLDYRDVVVSNSWAKEAIYRAGALNILKGYGEKNFGLYNSLSREEAIALLYRAAGREEEAQIASQGSEGSAIKRWADGYLRLAAADGLITYAQLNDALSEDQASLEAGAFFRYGAAQRQEMAYWTARVLGIQPVYTQQKLFNSFVDWKQTDPDYIPYIEAVLQAGIINGDGAGHLNPLNHISREQAAQILSNAEEYIYLLLGLEKHIGFVEDIGTLRDFTGENKSESRIISVRTTDGTLEQISLEPGTSGDVTKKDTVVYKNGYIGGGRLLSDDDRMEYITNENNEVIYVNVFSNRTDTSYMVVKVDSLNPDSREIAVTQYFEIEYPDIELASATASFDPGDNAANALYPYSNSAYAIIDGIKTTVDKLSVDSVVVITVKNGLVMAAEVFDLSANPEEKNIICGIVEENNPELGYISLYNEDGTGVSASNSSYPYILRTYYYLNPKSLEVYKNHADASVYDIETGDTVFLKVDDENNVSSISAVDNYIIKYGNVVSKSLQAVVVEFDDGLYQSIAIHEDLKVIEDGRLVDYDSIKDGDRLRMTLLVTNKSTYIKQARIETGRYLITGLYRGTVSHIDKISGSLVVMNTEAFKRGRWERTEEKGFLRIKTDEAYEIFEGGERITSSELNSYYKFSEAYIAVRQDYGGEELVTQVSLRNENDTEVIFDDSIAYSIPGSGRFTIADGNSTIECDSGSIIIKEGRLVGQSSIASSDKAYVVANRNYNTGDFNASIISIENRAEPDSLVIYRGRISGINENSDFTVESYSMLSGAEWEYVNTPRTFKINYDTRMTNEEGIVNIREFTGYGEESYIEKTVYIVAKGVNALLISDAPYGIHCLTGEIYKTANSSSFELVNSSVYDRASNIWVPGGEKSVEVFENSIVIKNDMVSSPSALQKGDMVRVIYKQAGTENEAYIITVIN